MIRRLVTATAVLTLALAGCGGASTGTVSGEVTLDDHPLKEGRIRFVPADGKTEGLDGPITDGKFSVSGVPVGDVKVEVTSFKVTGTRKVYDTPDSPTVDVGKQIIPPRYNTQTELKMTVQGGSQEKKFALKGK
jgi:hypothetical protein